MIHKRCRNGAVLVQFRGQTASWLDRIIGEPFVLDFPFLIFDLRASGENLSLHI
jgi:hypothetical protein